MTRSFALMSVTCLVLSLHFSSQTPRLGVLAASVTEFETDFKDGYQDRAALYYAHYDEEKAGRNGQGSDENGLDGDAAGARKQQQAKGESDATGASSKGSSASGDTVDAKPSSASTALVSFLGACRDDSKKLCKQENSYGATQCMKERLDELSPLCREYFKAKTQCYSELQELGYCTPAKLTCLATHANDKKLSIFCRQSKFAQYVKSAIPAAGVNTAATTAAPPKSVANENDGENTNKNDGGVVRHLGPRRKKPSAQRWLKKNDDDDSVPQTTESPYPTVRFPYHKGARGNQGLAGYYKKYLEKNDE